MKAAVKLPQTQPYLRRANATHYVVPGACTPDRVERELIRVTKVTGSLDKPALVQWSANLERAAMLEACETVMSELEAATPWPLVRARLLELAGPARAHQRELAKAGDIGTIAHAMIEAELRKAMGRVYGAPDTVPDAAQWAFMAWQDWWKEQDVELVDLELALWSEDGSAGRADVVARMRPPGGTERVPVVGDWKTSKAIYFEHKLQGAAYCHHLVERGVFDEWPWLLELRLPKIETDPNFEAVWVEPEETQRLYEVFRHLVPVAEELLRQQRAERKAWMESRK